MSGRYICAATSLQHELQHLELVEREAGHPLRELAGVVDQLVVRHALEDHPDPGRLLARDRVAGEEVALRLFEAEARDPDPRRLGDAPDPRRRVAERRGLGRDDQVGVEDEVRAPGDAPAVDRRDGRLADLVQPGERLGEPADHAEVGHRVPDPVASLLLGGLRRGRPVEAVAAAERRSLGTEQHHADGGIAVRVVERRDEVVAQLRGDGVVLVGTAQHEVPDRAVVLDSDRRHVRTLRGHRAQLRSSSSFTSFFGATVRYDSSTQSQSTPIDGDRPNGTFTHPALPRPYPLGSAPSTAERLASCDSRSFTREPGSTCSGLPRNTKIFFPTFTTTSPQGWSSHAPGSPSANSSTASCLVRRFPAGARLVGCGRSPGRTRFAGGTASDDDAVEQTELDRAPGLGHPPVEVGPLPVPHEPVLVLGDVEGHVPPELDQPEEQREVHRVVVVARRPRRPGSWPGSPRA